jgi:hypothetical protein
MSIFYFKTYRILVNLHKIFLYLFLKYFQVYSKGNYSSFEYYGDNSFKHSLEEYLGVKATNHSKFWELSEKNLIIIENFTLKIFVINIFKLNRIRVIDKHYFGLVGANTLFRLLFNDFTNSANRKKIMDNAMHNYENYENEIKEKEDIYVLGNNEQFSKLLSKHKPKYLLTCNSAINNPSIFDSELLVLSFSDPLFHFGINEQAIDYRKKLEVVLRDVDTNIYLVVPIEGIPLVEKLDIDKKIKIIGLDSTYFQRKLLKTKKNKVFTRNSHNVFTQYLLPISSLNKNTINIGAVTFSSNDRFSNNLWTHDKQLKDAANYNFAFDESFFGDRDFKKYYKFHDKQLVRIVNRIYKKKIINEN